MSQSWQISHSRRKVRKKMNKSEKYRQWYESGIWTKQMLKNVVKKGKLTTEEYEEITGEKFLND